MNRLLRRVGVWLLLIALVAAWASSDILWPPEQLRLASVHVRDGDTLAQGERVIRLAGIDAPEYRQTCASSTGAQWPCGQAARQQLAALTAAGPIICAPEATDRYGRIVAACTAADGSDLGQAMVAAGLAISPAERGEARYGVEQDGAQRARRGIWQGRFDLPADWRDTHSRRD